MLLPHHASRKLSETNAGLIWSEVKQLWDIGLQEYVNDMWNVIDFVTNSLYVATVALRVVSYFQVSQKSRTHTHTPLNPFDSKSGTELQSIESD